MANIVSLEISFTFSDLIKNNLWVFVVVAAAAAAAFVVFGSVKAREEGETRKNTQHSAPFLLTLPRSAVYRSPILCN